LGNAVVAPFWACCRLEPRRSALGIAGLARAGFSPWYPQIREHRVRGGRRAPIIRPLFAGYAFIVIRLQWHQARWAPGVLNILMANERPAQVPDAVIDELRARERNGLVQIPELPRLKAGDPIRVRAGLMIGALGLYAGQRSGERIAVLLASLRVVLPAADVAPV
jgi:transcriptional antiterminator RfaH